MTDATTSRPRAGIRLAGPRAWAWRDTDSSGTGRNFVGMELLRASASVAVVVYHAHSIALKRSVAAGTPIVREPMWSYVAIDLFFVMSGFLMVHMAQRLYGRPGGVGTFATRRLARTPPLYWAYTAVLGLMFVTMPWLPGANGTDVGTVLRSLAFLPQDRAPVIPLGWTLNLEVFFYVTVAVGIPFTFRTGPWVTAVLLTALVALGRMAGSTGAPADLWTEPLLLDCVLGIVAAKAFHSGVRLGPAGRVACMAAAVVLVSIPSEPPAHAGAGTLDRVCTLGLAAFLLVCSATLLDGDVDLGPATRPVRVVSDMSYTVYLLHILVLKAVEAPWFKVFGSGTTSSYAYVVVGTALVLPASWATYLVTERPLARWLKPLAAGGRRSDRPAT